MSMIDSLSREKNIDMSAPVDTFKIAEMLLKDDQDLIHKATGWMLQTTGGVHRQGLLSFLDKHAATMPRTLLRYSIENLDKKEREHYMGMKKIASKPGSKKADKKRKR